jgi:hypothetical protein
VIDVLKEDDKTLFRKSVNSWKEDNQRDLENSIPRIKGAHVKKVRHELKLLMDELTKLVEKWSKFADDEDDWEEIFKRI